MEVVQMRQIVICDDNPHDIANVRTILHKHISECNMQYDILDFPSGESLIQACEAKTVAPDIIFMDIELDGINGIETVTSINKLLPNCHIIYTTNNLQYATDVYTTEHRYYVLKPEFEQRLPAVFDKIVKLTEESSQEFVIPLKRSGQVVVNKKDIIFVERYGRGTIFNVNNTIYESKLSLVDTGDSIGNNFLIPCHNSFYIGLSHVKTYTRNQIELEYDITIPVSRKYQPLVKSEFTRWTQAHLFHL